MNPEPRGQSLHDLTVCLVRGDHPVIAEIEPGDATYYNLLLVPAWGAYVLPHLKRYGISAERGGEFLIVTRLRDQEGETFYATPHVGEWDLHGIENAWSRELLVWWLRILWAEIEAERAR